MTFLFKTAGIFIWGLSYALGDTPRDLDELEAAGLLAGSAALLAQVGYRRCRTLGLDQTFLQFVGGVARRAMAAAAGTPRCLLFQHGYAESATAPWDANEPDAAARKGYFAPTLMREIGLDHVPFVCQFETGCAGFAFLLMAAGGQVLSHAGEGPIVCIMGDCRPQNGYCDMARERILGSDHASSFVVGHEPGGDYQVLGVSCYSTARAVVPLVELVQRAAGMIKDTAGQLSIDLKDPRLVVHYPNIFPDAWRLVSRSLRLRPEQQVMLDLPERAHCGASDALISLARVHRGEEGRTHVVISYGAGVHLAVTVLQEKRGGTLGG